MTGIRILMADDSAAVRKLVRKTLTSSPDIAAFEAACDGKEALELMPKFRPDVILLDVEMPVMDGIDTLRQIRLRDKTTPVLMFSSLTVRGGQATLDALAMGANDYVPKPPAARHVQDAMNYINKELLSKIKQWGGRAQQRTGPAVRIGQPAKAGTTTTPTNTSSPSPGDPVGPIDVIAIGSSTGGPNALAEVITKLPRRLNVPVLIVQHMPTVFTKLLADKLDKLSALKVCEAEDGEAIRPGQVYIAPGDYHMVVEKRHSENRIKLNQAAPENSCRPAVDVLFRSVARAYGKQTMAVILTGMGKDGLAGCRELSKLGAHIVAQDQATSVVWGMPREIEEAGLANTVLPIKDIHYHLTRYATRVKPKPSHASA